MLLALNNYAISAKEKRSRLAALFLYMIIRNYSFIISSITAAMSSAFGFEK